MNEHFDLVIFDCDGVLVDSEILAVEVDKRLCADLGWELTIDEIVDRFLGKSTASFAAQIEDHLGIKLPEDWEDKYRPWFFEAKTLGLTGLLERFEGRIFSSSELQNGKPAPDIFLHAAQEMGHEAARCVVVEESKYGVRAARAAGMHAFGYAGGLTPAEWLEEGATVVHAMSDLPQLLRAHEPVH